MISGCIAAPARCQSFGSGALCSRPCPVLAESRHGVRKSGCGELGTPERLDLFEGLPLDRTFGKDPKVTLPGKCSRSLREGELYFQVQHTDLFGFVFQR